MSIESPPRVASASFAYPFVDGQARARLTTSMTPAPRDGTTFVLSTCLRTEVFVAGDDTALSRTLGALFGELPEASLGKHRHGVDALEHLYRVAAGLESPIRGEGEILTQFRQRVSTSVEDGNVGGIFAKLLENAVAVGRQAREQMPESPHDSMAAVAAQAVGTADRVAVFGSGAMATAVVTALRGLPAPPRITIVARTPRKVTPADVSVWPFDRALEALAEFPAVVSATSAKRRLLDPSEMERAIRRRTQPLTLIDMAMPPDFTSPTATGLRYLDIDDLARMADRRPRGDEADALVRAAAEDAHRAYVEHHQVGPVIGSLTRRADEIVDAALDRFGGRLSDPSDLGVLRQTAHTVARTLLAGPISYVKQPDRAPEAVDIVADAFGVDA